MNDQQKACIAFKKKTKTWRKKPAVINMFWLSFPITLPSMWSFPIKNYFAFFFILFSFKVCGGNCVNICFTRGYRIYDTFFDLDTLQRYISGSTKYICSSILVFSDKNVWFQIQKYCFFPPIKLSVNIKRNG